MKNYALLRAFISFWCWIGVTLLGFMLAILAAVPGTLPDAVVFVVAVVIFAAAIAVPIINPGVFSKQHSTKTGG